MSSGLAPPRMRKKPALCSKVLAPSPVTFIRSWRRAEGAVGLRASAPPPWPRCLDRPETRLSSGTEAVFRSTPTEFTQSSTTASSVRASSLWFTSCWYWPTPMLLGSIFTSSASGSCRRRAMLAAPRRLTSTSGISWLAYSEAEYTEAPASLTTTFSTLISGAPACAAILASSLIRSAASLSVSRLAVPLPMAIRFTPCLAHSLPSVCSEPSQSLRGSCGNTVAVSTSLPVASTTATFTPVRMPGSSPITTRGTGGRCQQQVAQVVGKHLDGDLLGVFAQAGKQVAFGGQG